MKTHSKSTVRPLLALVLAVAFGLMVGLPSTADAAPSGFRLPFAGSAAWSTNTITHTGKSSEAIDFWPSGDRAWDGQVLASEGGQVIYAGYQVNTPLQVCPINGSRYYGYGNLVVLYHPGSGYQSYYAHLSSIAVGLSVGDSVQKGELLGQYGDTGCAQGAHLHFEIRSGAGQMVFAGQSVYIRDLPGVSSDGTAEPPQGVAQPGSRAIGSGQSLTGTIDPATAEDTYYFDGADGQRATIRMDRTSGGLDSYLYLYGPDGSLVAYDDDSPGSTNALISAVQLSSTGRYRIVARSYNHASTGGYSLRLDLVAGSAGGVGQPVTLCEHIYYAGMCQGFSGDQAWLGDHPIGNDRASSLRVSAGWSVTIFQDWYFQGRSWCFAGDEPDFTRYPGFNDAASSIQVRQGGCGGQVPPQQPAAPRPSAPVVTPPSAPAPWSPVGTSVPSHSSVTLVWGGVAGAAAYDVELWGGVYGSARMTPCTATGATTCFIGAMWDGGPYYWHVRARNASGTGPWSGDVSFSIAAAGSAAPAAFPAGVQPPSYAPSFAGQTVSWLGNSFRSDDGRTWIFQGSDISRAPGGSASPSEPCSSQPWSGVYPSYAPSFAGQTVSWLGNNFRSSADGRTWIFQGSDACRAGGAPAPAPAAPTPIPAAPTPTSPGRTSTGCPDGQFNVTFFRNKDFTSPATSQCQAYSGSGEFIPGGSWGWLNGTGPSQLGGQSGRYSIRWLGWFFCSAGRLSCWTRSDDGSVLSVDRIVVVDNAGDHGDQRRDGNISISGGWHLLQIDLQQEGGATLIGGECSL